MERQFTSNGRKFLLAIIALRHEAERQGKRLRLGKITKAWNDGEIARLYVKISIK